MTVGLNAMIFCTCFAVLDVCKAGTFFYVNRSVYFDDPFFT